MKVIFKNFIITLTRFKVQSLLAVAGLAIAYTIFYMVIVQSFYDLHFDRNFEKANNIYLYSRIIPKVDFFRFSTNAIEPRECANRYSEIKNFCYFKINNNKKILIKDDNTNKEQIISESVTSTSIGFIEMFKPKILFGDIKKAFTDGNAMLTESVSKKIFGNKYPVGEIINFDNQKYTIAAICADFPDNCSMKNGVYIYQPETDRSQWSYTTYFEISPSNRDKLLKKMNDEQYIQKTVGKENQTWKYELTALPGVHLWFPAKGEGNPVTVIVLLSVGILLLVVCYINFVNFFVAMASVIVKYINIRKILGESSLMLKFSIVLNAVFLSFISFLLSILFIRFLNTGALKDFFIADLAITKNWGLLFFATAISIFSGFLAGIYPAYHTTSFCPAIALSGAFSLSSQSKWLRHTLIGMQFIVAIFLITTMLFVKIQYEYMKNKDWGIQTKNVLYLNTESNKNNVENFMVELKKGIDISDVTAGEFVPGRENFQDWGTDFESVPIKINVINTYPNFLDFFGVSLVQGETFKDYDQYKMILNNSFLKEYGFTKDNVIHKYIDKYEIIGTVKDFNYHSAQIDIQPLAFVVDSGANKKYFYNWVFIKTNGENTKQTIEFIGNTWKEFSNEPVEVLSLTKTIQSLYQKEYNTASLVSICGIIAIIVAMIGLYGLILFDAKAKRKSIAIRKIHGATISEIMLMLNKNLLIQFAVSCLIAFPLAYYAVHRWLEQFAYKIPIYWWVFALGGIIVLAVSLITVSWESYKAANANPAEVIRKD